MLEKLPFDKSKLENIIEKYPTPFYLYDEKGLRDCVRNYLKAFAFENFKQYFAVKATPNPHIMKILIEEGCGLDCSSLPELILAEKCGIKGEEIMFSSNNTPLEEYKKALQLGAIINLDDVTHIKFLNENLYIPETICLRYNPGEFAMWNDIIGKPQYAKFGFTKEQLFYGYKILKEMGVKKFGLHTMLISNELQEDYFVETAKLLFELVIEIHQKLGIKIDFVNFGGGIGIPYRPHEKVVSTDYLGKKVKETYDEIILKAGLHPLKLCTELGRYITGPYGFLISKVIHKKNIYKNYIGIDASMADLMRPAMYEAYHHITVPGKEDLEERKIYDVIGSLCENNDKFAIDRKLPPVDTGDIIVIHDAGAHSHAMGFNYNGKLRCAELLLKEDGNAEMVRRAETLDDYFATLNF